MGRRRIKVKPKKSTPAESAKFKLRVLTIILCIIFAIPVVFLADRYTFVNSELPFWEVSLAIGLIVSIVVNILYDKRKRWKSKTERIVLRIMVFFLTAFYAFALPLFGFWHLNHSLDSGEAIRYYVEIEDKNYHYKHRGLDTHKFTFTVNGDTFDIDVPLSDYNSHDVGDSYVIEYHEGALGEPYYIAVGPVP